MRRPFTTLLAVFLLVALVADADARTPRRDRAVYYSSGYYVPDGTVIYASGTYMPDSSVIVERPTSGEIRFYYTPGTIVSPGVEVLPPTSTRSFYYEPGTYYVYPQGDVIYRTRGGRVRVR
jgi:hypothetical protein